MPNEVRSARAAPCCSSTFISASLATIIGSLMRMRRRILRSQQNHEFTAGAADVARPNRKDGVPRARLLQQVLDAFLHGAEIVNVLVAGGANGGRPGLAILTRGRAFVRPA